MDGLTEGIVEGGFQCLQLSRVALKIMGQQIGNAGIWVNPFGVAVAGFKQGIDISNQLLPHRFLLLYRCLGNAFDSSINLADEILKHTTHRTING